jgi:hypothetical protein
MSGGGEQSRDRVLTTEPDPSYTWKDVAVDQKRLSCQIAKRWNTLGQALRELLEGASLAAARHPPIAPTLVGDFLFAATCEPSINQPALASPAHSAVKKCWRGDQARRDHVRIVSPRRYLAAPRRAGPRCRGRGWQCRAFTLALLTPQRSVLRPGHGKKSLWLPKISEPIPSRRRWQPPRQQRREIECCSSRRCGSGHRCLEASSLVARLLQF